MTGYEVGLWVGTWIVDRVPERVWAWATKGTSR
jgi:hypothetical protein